MFKSKAERELEKLLGSSDENVRLQAAAELAKLAERRRRSRRHAAALRAKQPPAPSPLTAAVLEMEKCARESAQAAPVAPPAPPSATPEPPTPAERLAAAWGLNVVEAPPPRSAPCSEPGCNNAAKLPEEWIEGRRWCHPHGEALKRAGAGWSRTVEPPPLSGEAVSGTLAGRYTAKDGMAAPDGTGRLVSERERLIGQITGEGHHD